MENSKFKEEHIDYVKSIPLEELYYYAVQWLNQVNHTNKIHKLWHVTEDDHGEKEKVDAKNSIQLAEAE